MVVVTVPCLSPLRSMMTAAVTTIACMDWMHRCRTMTRKTMCFTGTTWTTKYILRPLTRGDCSFHHHHSIVVYHLLLDRHQHSPNHHHHHHHHQRLLTARPVVIPPQGFQSLPTMVPLVPMGDMAMKIPLTATTSIRYKHLLYPPPPLPFPLLPLSL